VKFLVIFGLVFLVSVLGVSAWSWPVNSLEDVNADMMREVVPEPVVGEGVSVVKVSVPAYDVRDALFLSGCARGVSCRVAFGGFPHAWGLRKLERQLAYGRARLRVGGEHDVFFVRRSVLAV